MDDVTNQTQTNNLISQQAQQDFLQQLGLNELPQERKQQLLAKMINVVMSRLMNRITAILTDQDAQALEKLVDTDKTGLAVNEFIMSRVPNFQGLLIEEIEKFKAEMQTSMGALDLANQT